MELISIDKVWPDSLAGPGTTQAVTVCKPASSLTIWSGLATLATRVSAAPPAPRAAEPAVPVGRATPEDEQAPSVWVDRVKPASEIYISRPDTKR